MTSLSGGRGKSENFPAQLPGRGSFHKRHSARAYPAMVLLRYLELPCARTYVAVRGEWLGMPWCMNACSKQQAVWHSDIIAHQLTLLQSYPPTHNPTRHQATAPGIPGVLQATSRHGEEAAAGPQLIGSSEGEGGLRLLLWQQKTQQHGARAGFGARGWLAELQVQGDEDDEGGSDDDDGVLQPNTDGSDDDDIAFMNCEAREDNSRGVRGLPHFPVLQGCESPSWAVQSWLQRVRGEGRE